MQKYIITFLLFWTYSMFPGSIFSYLWQKESVEDEIIQDIQVYWNVTQPDDLRTLTTIDLAHTGSERTAFLKVLKYADDYPTIKKYADVFICLLQELGNMEQETFFEGATLVRSALNTYNLPAIKTLIQAGADINKDYYLHWAINDYIWARSQEVDLSRYDFSIINYFLNNPDYDKNKVHPAHGTAMQFACKAGAIKVLDCYTQAGLNPLAVCWQERLQQLKIQESGLEEKPDTVINIPNE